MQLAHSLIITLLLANLGATIWFGINKDSTPAVAQTTKNSTHELPSSVGPDVRQSLYEGFSEAFNSSDFDALYNMLGPVAQAEVSRETVDKEFKKLIKFFHSVKGGAYSHSELVGSKGNTNIYVLNYSVKLPESSEFGTQGTLTITLAVQNDGYQVYGIRLDAG
ncbi:hypothetical protein Q9252_00085 [Marinobacter salarius]|uniref:hypothetical protein n=1 Tax=Marinobacter salarius TaxID=1420917 RepID=UPI00273BCE32|nr:hypothetical protein [Marinobacter salarius]MDP4530514.1 hypothetical protein [Marinobacter salarius]